MSAIQQHSPETSRQPELLGVPRFGPTPHVPIDAEKVVEAVCTAFQAPLGYPPLAAATVPGDRVVVALAAGLPLMREIIAGVTEALRLAGVDKSHTTILYSHDHSESSTGMDKWSREQGFTVELHNPGDENSCSLFGVARSGHALRLNRKLCEADIVLPIGLTSISLVADCDSSRFSGLYPQFSDEQTLARHHGPVGTKAGETQSDRQKEIDESGWQLGVGLSLQVVPGEGGTLAALIAGEPEAAAKAAAEKYREVWRRTVDFGGDLVIARVVGPDGEQSWENIGRALQAADQVLESGGSIALCTQLAEQPGLSLRRLKDNSDISRLERKLDRDSWADSRTARVICQALQRGTVYLASQLESGLVESLGFAPIAGDAELMRLVKSHRRPLVLDDAHRLLPVLASRSP